MQKMEALLPGEIPIYEPGLSILAKRNFPEGRVQFTTDVAEGVVFGGLVFIAVDTPSDGDGSTDLKYVLAVAETIGQCLQGQWIE